MELKELSNLRDENSWTTGKEMKLNDLACPTITATAITTTAATATAITNNNCIITDYHSDIENSLNDKTDIFQGMNSHLK